MIERCKSAQLELLAATTIEARVTPTRNPTTIEATTSLRLHVPCRIPRDTNSDAGPGVRGSTELPIGIAYSFMFQWRSSPCVHSDGRSARVEQKLQSGSPHRAEIHSSHIGQKSASCASQYKRSDLQR